MSEHPEYCQKAAEIAKLESQVETLNGIVMGNGQPGLAQTVPVLNRNVSELNLTIGNLTTGVSGLLQFQENQLGIQAGKDKERENAFKHKHRNQWIIGLLVTVIVGMIGLLIFLADKVINHPGV